MKQVKVRSYRRKGKVVRGYTRGKHPNSLKNLIPAKKKPAPNIPSDFDTPPDTKENPDPNWRQKIDYSKVPKQPNLGDPESLKKQERLKKKQEYLKRLQAIRERNKKLGINQPKKSFVNKLRKWEHKFKKISKMFNSKKKKSKVDHTFEHFVHNISHIASALGGGKH
jgi:hypothetical protein